MVKIISIKCPACGANLSVGDDRETYDCEYCGTRVKVHDNDVERLRAEQEMRFREMEMNRKAEQADKEFRFREKERQQRFQDERENRAREMERKKKEADDKQFFKTWGYLMLMSFAMMSLALCMIPPYFIGIICLLITVAVGVAIFVIPMLIKNNKQFSASAKRGINNEAGYDHQKNQSYSDNMMQYKSSGGVEITPEMLSCIGKPYGNIGYLFAGAGFTNITAVPLNDLNPELKGFEGQVVSVLLNGKPYYHIDEQYPRETSVIITYHSVKE